MSRSTLLQIPEEMLAALKPVFDQIPPEEAMPTLQGGSPKLRDVVEAAIAGTAVPRRAGIAAGLWLYVDDLDRAHTVAQAMPDSTGSMWHGIMHRREGDFSNSLYWFRRASGHPVMAELAPEALVQAVSRANGRDIPELVERQRREWCRLFEYCCR